MGFSSFCAHGGLPSSSNSAHWKNEQLKSLPVGSVLTGRKERTEDRRDGGSGEGLPLFSWYISHMTHPHVSATVLLLPLNAAQDGSYIAPATRRVPAHGQRSNVHEYAFETCNRGFPCLPGVKAFAVVAVRDINAFVSCDWMRINGRCGMNAVLPLFLHFGVHHQ